MEIIKICDNNKQILCDFISHDLPSSFRYFKKRTIDCIKNHYITIVGVIDNNIMSYAHIDFDDETKKYWFGICVLNDYQHHGYGKQLVKYIIDIFDESEIDNLYLTVDHDNNIARKLYLENGFEIIDDSKTYYIMKLSKYKNVLYLPVSYGEALDKLSILYIKYTNINDERKYYAKCEYDMLYGKLQQYIDKCKFYYDELNKSNLIIWNLQNEFRKINNDTMKYELCDRIMNENNRRFRIKNKINNILNSTLKEQKGYDVTTAVIYFDKYIEDIDKCISIIIDRSLSYDNVKILCNKILYDKLINIISDKIITMEITDLSTHSFLLSKYKYLNCDIYVNNDKL